MKRELRRIPASKKIRKLKKRKPIHQQPKKTKEPKPDTKELSFDLYKKGKTIGEIAIDRGFAITTIENHLAHYVSLGLIPVTQFISKEKFETIILCSKKYEGLSTTSIKQDLGDEYSYSDIRFALATQKHLNKD